MERIIVIENEELKKALQQKDDVVTRVKEQHARWQEEEEKLKVLGEEVQSMKDVIIPIMESEEARLRAEQEFTPYEIFNAVSLNDEGGIFITIIDELEHYKGILDKKYADAANAEENTEDGVAEDEQPGEAGKE